MAEQAKKRDTMPGTCVFCHETFSKSGMNQHLKHCKTRDAYNKITREDDPRPRKKFLHIFVEGTYAPEYWMHLEVPATEPLKVLDTFLRAIWLECCGHLSQFTIDGVSYLEDPEPFDFPAFSMRDEQKKDRNLAVPLEKVLQVGKKFGYEYDFGSTTYLNLRVVAERVGVDEADETMSPVFVIARNTPPSLTCEKCGKPAQEIVSGFFDGEEHAFCNKCVKKLDADMREMTLPIVNSPRMGVCGYTG